MQVFSKAHISLSLQYTGYIAGSGNGIVTAGGQPRSRKLYVLDALSLITQRAQWSLNNGHYAVFGLDPEKHYLVMVRDYKKEFEPFAWDFVKPANDLTIEQQQALWQTWQ